VGPNCGIASTPCTQGPQTITQGSAENLYIPSGVTLDLGGNILTSYPSGCSGNVGAQYTMVSTQFWDGTTRGGVQSHSASLAPVSQSNEGSLTITITASSFVSAGLAAGQYCVVNSPTVDGLTAGNFATKLTSFVNSTGVMTFRDALPAACVVGTCTVACYRSYSWPAGAGLRNGQLLGAGTCNSVAVTVMVIDGVDRFSMSDMVITGSFASATGFKWLDTNRMIDSNFERIMIRDLVGSTASNVWRISSSTGSVYADISITNALSTFGVVLISSFYTVLDNIVIDSINVQALDITSAGYNMLSNIKVVRDELSGTNGAVSFDTRGRRNVVNGLEVTGTANTAPLIFVATGDHYNQLYGCVFRNPAITLGPRITGSAYGNFIEGDLDLTASQVGSADPWLNNAYRNLNGPNGHAYIGLRNATLTNTDFPAMRMYAFYAATDTAAGVALMGVDGTIRRQTITLS
jgi:hypothetical protein